ncbi:MAG: hypothetical protein J6I73_09320 [Treponema sp.]|nr:hypothetical protein [Treponema sp.]
MNRTITDKNLYVLLPGKVTAVVAFIAEDKHVHPLDALRAFYYSNTYKNLEVEKTKLWHYGPVALYEEYEEVG